MKKEFQDEQLYLIRDAFADLCSNSMERGDRESAEEELEVINIVQSQLGEDEYEDLPHFALVDGGTWHEMDEREVEDSERAAVDALVKWAKSTETEPTAELQEAVDRYLSDYHINGGNCAEHIIAHRLIAIDGLIILAIRPCSSAELHKMDTVKQRLAEHLPEGKETLSTYVFEVIDTETKKEYTVSTEFENYAHAADWAENFVEEPYYIERIKGEDGILYHAMYEGQKFRKD